eukprot:Clim_evm59s33 gene=Clim_evmTU59s33
MGKKKKGKKKQLKPEEVFEKLIDNLQKHYAREIRKAVKDQNHSLLDETFLTTFTGTDADNPLLQTVKNEVCQRLGLHSFSACVICNAQVCLNSAKEINQPVSAPQVIREGNLEMSESVKEAQITDEAFEKSCIADMEEDRKSFPADDYEKNIANDPDVIPEQGGQKNSPCLASFDLFNTLPFLGSRTVEKLSLTPTTVSFKDNIVVFCNFHEVFVCELREQSMCPIAALDLRNDSRIGNIKPAAVLASDPACVYVFLEHPTAEGSILCWMFDKGVVEIRKLASIEKPDVQSTIINIVEPRRKTNSTTEEDRMVFLVVKDIPDPMLNPSREMGYRILPIKWGNKHMLFSLESLHVPWMIKSIEKIGMAVHSDAEHAVTGGYDITESNFMYAFGSGYLAVWHVEGNRITRVHELNLDPLVSSYIHGSLINLMVIPKEDDPAKVQELVGLVAHKEGADVVLLPCVAPSTPSGNPAGSQDATAHYSLLHYVRCCPCDHKSQDAYHGLHVITMTPQLVILHCQSTAMAYFYDVKQSIPIGNVPLANDCELLVTGSPGHLVALWDNHLHVYSCHHGMTDEEQQANGEHMDTDGPEESKEQITTSVTVP